MSVESLLDGLCIVFRLTETLTPLRALVNEYNTVAEGVPLYLAPTAQGKVDEGAGEGVNTQTQGFMSITADVQEEDVLDVTDGPEAPALLRVVTLRRPRGHHIELVLERFSGGLS